MAVFSHLVLLLFLISNIFSDGGRISKAKKEKKKKKKKKERKKEEEQEKGAGRRSWRVSMSLFTATSGEVIPQLHF